MRCQLAIIQNHDALLAIVLRQRLAAPSLAAIFQREIGGDIQTTLALLRKDCEASGYANVWNKPAMLNINAENAVFHDFLLPTASKNMARKTIPLLLESEFPFELAEFDLATHFFRYGEKKLLGAIATLLPKTMLKQWQGALAACGLPAARVFVSPWPLIACLRAHAKNALLLCTALPRATLCALDADANPMRIQTFALPDSSDPESLACQARRMGGLLLAGLPFKPKILLLAGQNLPPGTEDAFGKAFELPVKRVAEEARPGGNPDWTGKSDLAWMQAVGMRRQALPRKMRIPVFALRMKANAANKNNRQLLLAAGCALSLCAAAGLASFLDALKYRSQAASLRAEMIAKLKAAMPDAPRNASAGKLRAILNSRLAQYENDAKAETQAAALELLENIHASLPASLDIDIHRFSLDDRHARVYGHAGSYDAVNAMKEKLEGVKGVAGCRIVSAATRPGRGGNKDALVEFELDLFRAAAP